LTCACRRKNRNFRFLSRLVRPFKQCFPAKIHILYINSLRPSVRACVCRTRQFRVLIRRQNRQHGWGKRAGGASMGGGPAGGWGPARAGE
jgi:hypothetical protein